MLLRPVLRCDVTDSVRVNFRYAVIEVIPEKKDDVLMLQQLMVNDDQARHSY